jgi:hypothetical protein
MMEQPHGATLRLPKKLGTKCGARTRRGTACGALAMRNARCRFHGGLSTGPTSTDGLERMRRAKITHGKYTAEARAENRRQAQTRRDCRGILAAARAYLRNGGTL